MGDNLKGEMALFSLPHAENKWSSCVCVCVLCVNVYTCMCVYVRACVFIEVPSSSSVRYGARTGGVCHQAVDS